jgi:acetoin utilization deacetylase AcuC-like enzyme
MGSPRLSIITSDRFRDHLMPPGHLECPQRITVARQALEQADFADRLEWISPRTATLEELELVHTAAHIKHVRDSCEQGVGYLDPDTPVCEASYEVALLSAGAWLTGLEEVLNRKRSAFVISRPPGHHAEHDRSMGFCLFSNCAIAARYALEVRKVKRVAILDWDVHHGNGTQHILEEDVRVAYCSLHQYPFYPGTGSAQERGAHDNVLNIALPAGSGVSMYREVMREMAIPFLRNFKPELLLVSAGSDATSNDPYAGMQLDPEDYVEFTLMARQICNNMLVGLEGGYDLDDLATGVTAVAGALLDDSPPQPESLER